MNRKKITLLLTGLVVASGMMMNGCSSSDNGSTNSSTTKEGTVSRNDNGFMKSTERMITEYANDLGDAMKNFANMNSDVGDNSNVAYAEDNTVEDMNKELNDRVNSTNDTINRSFDDKGYDGDSYSDTQYNYETQNSSDGNYSVVGYSENSLNDVTSYDNMNSYQNNQGINGTASAFDGGLVYDESGVGDTINGGSFNNDTTNGYDTSLYNGTNSTTELNNEDKTNEISMNTPSQESTVKENQEKTGAETSNVDGSSYMAPQARTAQTIVGEFIPVKAVGGSEIVGTQGDGKVQGTIGLTFKLSKEAIDAVDGLDTAIQEAYTETINDSNNSFEGTGTTTKREALQAKLKTMFSNNNTLKLMFKDPNGTIVNIPITDGTELFPDNATNKEYVRHIIDLGAMKSGGLRNIKSVKSSSPDVAMRMIIRNKTVDNTDNDELKTNTLYTFVGIGGTGSTGNNLKIDSTKYISGFSVPSTTTGKQSSKLVVKSEGTTNALLQSADFNGTEGSAVTGEGLYITVIDSAKEFIDTVKYDFTKPSNVVAGGNNIKFPNIKFTDTDNSIVKIEMEDVRGNKYPCALIATDTPNEYCLQVNGLETETRYTFTKINVTSNITGTEETDSILLAESGSGNPKVKTNTKELRTVKFTEPRLELGGTSPDGEVTLPDGLKVKAVKNDATALRYILKADNSLGNIENVKVSGLKNDEKSTVEKMVDKKAKVNYYIITLSNLQKDSDYGYVTLELDYKDLAGNDKNARQSINNINTQIANKPQYDNRTEKEALTGTNAVNVILNTENTSKYARTAQIPVFIDDMNGAFTGMKFTSTDNPNAKVEYSEGYLYVTGLEPEKTINITLDFTYNDANNKEQKLTKYIKITTAAAPKVDVIADTATVKGTDVSVKFDYAKMPSIKIKSVSIKDENDKVLESTWDSETSTATLKGLKANTKYSGLIATFTLENSLTVDYPITSFTTEGEIVKPTGKVADFVRRVYAIALGREPEVEGWNFWIDKLQKKEITATEFIAENLMTQPEFVDRELSKSKFVTTMYSLIVNREPDADGQSYWERKYEEYKGQVKNIAELRIKIAREMMDQQEFKELVTNLNLKY